MAIGERIHFFRSLRGMTQKYLGMAVGFPERTADVRMAQYESGTRTPKADLTSALAHVLDVSPQALNVPDIDSYIGLAHTLFTLEDTYGLTVKEVDGKVCLQVDPAKGRTAEELHKILTAWREQAAKLETGEITQEDYDKWRYRYPELDTTQRWVKLPSQKLSDMLSKDLKKFTKGR
ncbi:helix-turn-helix domain-containing protein [Bittarella massiliensis (ex Durand et al. 2017)]|uniref:helix-turn-helix domain-containing protein n=1 Tax=Bittarella massiliensis (ex Durand et al. 2017) TaxID=1720313 RepID=UPI001AA0CD90|nr:helix-turn-helix transcriptional regulator [Bittarella massiliensis (ex Durand et al. 2017)]MBO1679963.1 helix-turn-helix transcriptional regulator [Bittarella massiliensis (ex Durand et al. 2017)]